MKDTKNNANEPKGKTGETIWEVQWCIDLPEDELGDCDPYDASYKEKYFKTKEAATKFAKKIYPKDVFGEVRIQEGHLELQDPEFPILGHMFESDGDPEFIWEEDL